MLINAYTLSTPSPLHIRFGVANYFSGGNNGNYFPRVLRLAGHFEEQDLQGASRVVSLFFMNVVPFYVDQQTTNQVTCKYTGIVQPMCRYYPSGLLGNGQSYHNYERIDVEFDYIPSGSGDKF